MKRPPDGREIGKTVRIFTSSNPLNLTGEWVEAMLEKIVITHRGREYFGTVVQESSDKKVTRVAVVSGWRAEVELPDNEFDPLIDLAEEANADLAAEWLRVFRDMSPKKRTEILKAAKNHQIMEFLWTYPYSYRVLGSQAAEIRAAQLSPITRENQTDDQLPAAESGGEDPPAGSV